MGIYRTHGRWSSFSIWKGGTGANAMWDMNDFFRSSMDLGLEPSAIFLSTQKSTNKGFKMQNTGDLPVLKEAFNHCHCSTGGRSIWTASGRNGSTGAGVTSWQILMWWKLGQKHLKISQHFGVPQTHIMYIYILYFIYDIYIYTYVGLGCWCFFLVLWCLVSCFFFKTLKIVPLGVFFGKVSWIFAKNTHADHVTCFPQGPKMSFFLFCSK